MVCVERSRDQCLLSVVNTVEEDVFFLPSATVRRTESASKTHIYPDKRILPKRSIVNKTDGFDRVKNIVSIYVNMQVVS